MRKAIITALALMIPGAAAAQEIDDAIEARKGYFTMLGMNMGGLSAMAKGEVDYDAQQAESYAENIATLSDYHIEMLFVPGSYKSEQPGKTRSLAVIGDDMQGFLAKYEAFGDAATTLEARAGEGRAELGKALGAVGGTCKSCHDDYRAADF